MYVYKDISVLSDSFLFIQVLIQYGHILPPLPGNTDVAHPQATRLGFTRWCKLQLTSLQSAHRITFVGIRQLHLSSHCLCRCHPSLSNVIQKNSRTTTPHNATRTHPASRKELHQVTAMLSSMHTWTSNVGGQLLHLRRLQCRSSNMERNQDTSVRDEAPRVIA